MDYSLRLPFFQPPKKITYWSTILLDAAIKAVNIFYYVKYSLLNSDKIRKKGGEEKEFSETMGMANPESDINQPSHDISMKNAAETRSGRGMFRSLIEEAEERKKERDDDNEGWKKS